MTIYTIRSLHSFGTWVRYDSKYNGSGEGTIVGIVLNDDASIYYYIESPLGEVNGGILPDDIVDCRKD